MGKGSKQRPTNTVVFNDNFDQINWEKDKEEKKFKIVKVNNKRVKRFIYR